MKNLIKLFVFTPIIIACTTEINIDNMPIENGKVVKPVNMADVQRILSNNSNQLSVLCTDPNINMWARYKPIRHPYLGHLTEDQRRSVNYGLEITKLTDLENPTAWGYNKPRINMNPPEACRLGDFDGYNPNAEPFCKIPDTDWDYIQTSLDNFYIYPYIKWGTNSEDSQGIINNAEILPSDLTFPESYVEIRDCYIGIYIKYNNVGYYVFSNKKIGEATRESPILIRFSDAPQIIKNYMNNLRDDDIVEYTPFFSKTNRSDTDYIVTLPNGQKGKITKKGIYKTIIAINTLVLSSSANPPGEMGRIPTGRPMTNPVLVKKPATQNSNEIITCNTQITISTEENVAYFMLDNIEMNINRVNVRNFINSFSYTETGIPITAPFIEVRKNNPVTLWAKTTYASYPFYNLPENDNTSSTLVPITIDFYRNQVQLVNSASTYTRWYRY